MGLRAGPDKCGKSRPNGIRSPDRPARSSVAIPTTLPGPHDHCNFSDILGTLTYVHNARNDKLSWCYIRVLSNLTKFPENSDGFTHIRLLCNRFNCALLELPTNRCSILEGSGTFLFPHNKHHPSGPTNSVFPVYWGMPIER